MSKSPIQKYVLSIVFAFSTLLLPRAVSAAPLNVTSSVSGNGPLFVYSYTVMNTSVPDLLSVTLTTPAQAGAVQSLTTPSGFSVFFDAGIGLVDFVADTRAFSIGSSISGFTLQSPFQLGAAPFSALSLDANQNPIVTTGVVSPAASPVPEPGAFGLVAASLLSAFAVYCRKHSTRIRMQYFL